MKSVRCNGCRCWFDSHHPECPECGAPRSAYNKWLRTAQLNNNLYAMADRSVSEDKQIGRAA